MLKTVRTLSILLLLFNGIGACYGGWHLITDPTGGTLQMPLYWIQNSPFKDYFIPGIILFLFNGLLSLIISALTIMKWRYYTKHIFMQGCVLTGWIVIQITMLQMVYFLHFIMGGTGLLLMFFGWILMKRTISNPILPPNTHQGTQL